MIQPQPSVFVIDDAAVVREVLDSLLGSVGLRNCLVRQTTSLKIASRLRLLATEP
jgi:CheY-like chemotaxis protein